MSSLCWTTKLLFLTFWKTLYESVSVWDKDKLYALLIKTWRVYQTVFPNLWLVNPAKVSQFMGLPQRNPATLWSLPWEFISFHETAIATKYEFRFISSWLLIIKTLSKTMINMHRITASLRGGLLNFRDFQFILWISWVCTIQEQEWQDKN